MATIFSQRAALAEQVLPFMGSCVNFEDLDAAALKAFVWMVGEFPSQVCYVEMLFKAAMERAFSSLDELVRNSGSNFVALEEAAEKERHLAVTLLKDLLAACCKSLFVDVVTTEEPFAILLSRMTERSDDIPFDTLERLQWTLQFMAKQPEVLRKIFSPEALEEQRRDRATQDAWVVQSPSLPLSRLNSVALVCPTHQLPLPFGRTKVT